MGGACDILAPIVVQKVVEIPDRASCFVFDPFCKVEFLGKFILDNCLLVSMFRLPKSVYTNIVDHFICPLLQLTPGIYKIGHLQCLIESEQRRLAKPVTPPTFRRSLDAMYQVELDLLDTRMFESVLRSLCVTSAQYILIEA